jgi:pre-rRNA-processing protein TSR2
VPYFKKTFQTAIDFVDYVTDSCVQSNAKVSEEDLMDLLEEIMDQECDTILEDESIKEISSILVRHLAMLKSGQLEAIQSELSSLPLCDQWIAQGRKINIINDPEDSSSDDDDDDDDGNDQHMNVTENLAAPSTSGSTMQVVEEDTTDPGWTVVRKGKRKA